MKKNRKIVMILAAAALSQALNLAACGSGMERKDGAQGQEAQEDSQNGGQEAREDSRSGDQEAREGSQNGGQEAREDSRSGSQEAQGASQGGESGTLYTPDEYEEVPRMTREEYPVVDGSTATIPLSTALYQLVTGASLQEAQGAVQHTKTTNAYMSLLYGYADLVIAYEPARSVYDYMEKNGQDLIIKPIGKDALVFLANEGNPVTSLSGRQLVDIYAGRYKNWAEAGGDTREIVAFQRPQGSGSQTLMEKLVMKGVPMAEAPQSYVIGEMGELIEKVAAYNNEENALGYSVYFYARNMYQKPGLTFMAVDGVRPDNETIKKGTYPYVNEFYAAVRAGEPEDSGAFRLFQWLTTKDGQRFVESLGYVGMEDVGQAAEPVNRQPDTKPGTVNLEDGTRLLLDRDWLEGVEGVAVLGQDLSIEQIITDKTIDSAAQAVTGGEPAVMTDLGTRKQGLYTVEQNRWVLEPMYDFLSFQEDGLYCGYKEYELYWIALDQEQQLCREAPGRFSRVGDCWWREAEDEIFEIFQGPEFPGENETPVKTLDFSGSDFNYGFEKQGCYIAVFLGGNRQVYDEGGELLFDREQMVGERPGEVYDITPQAVCMGMWDGSDSYIYNFREGRVVTEPGDWAEGSMVCGGAGYFSVTRGGRTFICDEHGKPVFSARGQMYSRFLGGEYCACWENGILCIEKPGTGEHYEIPRFEDTGGRVISGNLFCLDGGPSGQKPALYRGNERLMEDEQLWVDESDEYSIIHGEKKAIAVDTDGNIICETTENEHLLGVYGGCLVMVRGNYICIMDRDGNCGFQTLSGYMAND